MLNRRPVDLPDLSDEYALSEEQIKQYKNDGHITLESVLSREEIEAYRPVIEQGVETYNREIRALEDRDTYGKAFIQVMNLWKKDELARRFVLARRLAEIAARLMQVQGVRIYHDQALFKEGGGGLTPWHQDQHHWPLDTNNTITIWIPLEDVTEDMGTLMYASGTHTEGYIGDLPISDETEEELQNYIQGKGYRISRSGDMNAGDAVLHSGWTLHRASPNTTDRTRKSMSIIYYEDGARVREPDNAERRRDQKQWLPGTKPGERADGPLHPVVYP